MMVERCNSHCSDVGADQQPISTGPADARCASAVVELDEHPAGAGQHLQVLHLGDQFGADQVKIFAHGEHARGSLSGTG